MTHEMERKVQRKLAEEFEAFEQKILSLSPKEILEHAREYVVRQAMAAGADRVLWSYSDEDAEVLLAEENLMSKVYRYYLIGDSDITRDLADDIRSMIDDLTEEHCSSVS